MSLENDPKETNGTRQPTTNDPEEVIDTPKEVEESNDEKIDEDFPGYPHYPAKDDILNPENYTERVDLDVENLTRSHRITPDHIRDIEGTPPVEADFTQVPEQQREEVELAPTSNADVTAEDLAVLGPKDEDMDMDEDEQLRARGWVPATGKDLDVPDADVDGNETPGEEDEENSYYSLGGDRMENLEENNGQNTF